MSGPPPNPSTSRARAYGYGLIAMLGAGGIVFIASTCSDPSVSPSGDSGDSGTGPATTAGASSGGIGSTTAAATATASSTGDPADGTGTEDDDSSGSTTGSPSCAKNVVLMGYWPPTNEMLRPWSTNPRQNPEGWVGENWEGYGFDVYSFFPEFPPDGDPSNDEIGDDGAVGSPRFDLRVDYQATSADFWRLVDTYQPVILLTTSRGGSIGWEIEALEGGHGQGNGAGPAFDWSSDQHGAVQFPTQETIEARSWDAISTHRQGRTLPSQLPMNEILTAADELGLTNVEIDNGTSGNFLSGFLGLHGLYYNQVAPHNVAAGHIHVGFGLPVGDASALIERTLHVVLQHHAADRLECPARRE